MPRVVRFASPFKIASAALASPPHSANIPSHHRPEHAPDEGIFEVEGPAVRRKTNRRNGTAKRGSRTRLSPSRNGQARQKQNAGSGQEVAGSKSAAPMRKTEVSSEPPDSFAFVDNPVDKTRTEKRGLYILCSAAFCPCSMAFTSTVKTWVSRERLCRRYDQVDGHHHPRMANLDLEQGSVGIGGGTSDQRWRKYHPYDWLVGGRQPERVFPSFPARFRRVGLPAAAARGSSRKGSFWGRWRGKEFH